MLLRRAALATEEARMSDAAEALSEAIEMVNDALLADLARIRLARVLQELDRSDDALAQLALVKNTGYRSWALEVQGDIYLATDQIESAHEAYSAAFEALSRRRAAANPRSKARQHSAIKWSVRGVPRHAGRRSA